LDFLQASRPNSETALPAVIQKWAFALSVARGHDLARGEKNPPVHTFLSVGMVFDTLHSVLYVVKVRYRKEGGQTNL
jgi:hypothetical protein